jgi:archaeosortase B (VPXXXP-CTERM-specific)
VGVFRGRREGRAGSAGAVPRGAAKQAGGPSPGRPMLRFVATFVLLAAVLFSLYQLSEATHRFHYVNDGNAALSGAILNLTGVQARRDGSQLSFPRGGMQIISECSAIYVAILFAAGVLAFPTTARARLRGLALGLPCIFLINILRLASLGAVIEHWPNLLPLFHEYLWQVFFILVVAGLYLLWIERIVPRERPHQPA